MNETTGIGAAQRRIVDRLLSSDERRVYRIRIGSHGNRLPRPDVEG